MSSRYCLLVLATTGLLTSCGFWKENVKPTEPSKPPVPAMCSVLCPEMPETSRSVVETVRDLRSWGSDCRSRQAECVGYLRAIR